MSLDIAAIQSALREDGLDGWLLYDFHGSNPIARRVARLDSKGKLTTRRWYYLIPSSGDPRSLVHVIEPSSLAHLPGSRRMYADRETLSDGIANILEGCRRIAMEFSPLGAIPYISRVDAGTVDTIRELGKEVISSGDLIQRFEAVWDDNALETHRAASKRLYRIKDRAFALISEQLRARKPSDEFKIQQAMANWFGEEGLVTDCLPVVAAGSSGGNPHYLPTASQSRPIHHGDLVLIDLWGKLETPGAVFADITWMGYAGEKIPNEYSNAFRVAASARDAAFNLVRKAASSGNTLRGWEVDRAARDIIDKAGFGQHFVHRTGHSLGESVHGNGVHMDDYETHDDRRLLPGTGFTIEPGLYFETFGVRTEINVFFGANGAKATGPIQTEITPLR